MNVNTVRPFLGYGNIAWDERNASARYNSLQASVQPDEKGLSTLDQRQPQPLSLSHRWVNFGNEGVSFHIAGRETQKLRIGAEFFNIFNDPNFSAVGAGFATATFGHVTAALDPREIQFSARLSF